MKSPSQLHLEQVHSPSTITIRRKEAYGPGLLVFFDVLTSSTHPLPNRETPHVAYFNRNHECEWDMGAT
jgi:hypothetical protein